MARLARSGGRVHRGVTRPEDLNKEPTTTTIRRRTTTTTTVPRRGGGGAVEPRRRRRERKARQGKTITNADL